MANGINKAIILGRIGQDPEVKYMPSGKAVVNISVATSEKWKDKQSGDQQEKTEWHRVSAFDRLAEIIGEYVSKGDLIYIEGKIQTRKWQDQSGNDRYTTEIIARDMQMLGNSGGSRQPDQQQSRPAPAPAQPSQPGDFDDSDIPF